MSDIKRHGHLSITRRTPGGVTHTDMHVTASAGASLVVSRTTSVTIAGDPATIPTDHFDPASCCGAREQAMIAALRAYLRPQTAPDCLLARLTATLDRCCEEAAERDAAAGMTPSSDAGGTVATPVATSPLA